MPRHQPHLAQRGQVPAANCGGAESRTPVVVNFRYYHAVHSPQPSTHFRRRSRRTQAHARRAQVLNCHAEGLRNGTAKPLICLRSCNKGPIFATETAEISLVPYACQTWLALLPRRKRRVASASQLPRAIEHTQLSACLARLACQACHPASQVDRYLQIMRRRRDPLNMERRHDSRGGLRALAFDLLALDDTDGPKQLAALDCTAQISFPRPAGDRWIYSILVNCCRSTHRSL